MIAPATRKRAVVALWCLAAAAGCAKVTEEAAESPAPARDPATVAEPAGAVAPEGDSRALGVEEPSASGASVSRGRQAPVTPPAAPAEAKLPVPPGSAAELPRTAAEPEVVTPTAPTAPVAPVAPAAPAAQEPERERGLVASAAAPRSAGTLDLASLLKRVRKTKAISLRTKLAMKKESDALLEGFRAYHAEHGAATLAELRRSYDALFRTLYSLLEEADPPLARDIDRSRAEIWAILADPIKFGASAASASARRTPAA